MLTSLSALDSGANGPVVADVLNNAELRQQSRIRSIPASINSGDLVRALQQQHVVVNACTECSLGDEIRGPLIQRYRYLA